MNKFSFSHCWPQWWISNFIICVLILSKLWDHGYFKLLIASSRLSHYYTMKKDELKCLPFKIFKSNYLRNRQCGIWKFIVSDYGLRGYERFYCWEAWNGKLFVTVQLEMCYCLMLVVFFNSMCIFIECFASLYFQMLYVNMFLILIIDFVQLVIM